MPANKRQLAIAIHHALNPEDLACLMRTAAVLSGAEEFFVAALAINNTNCNDPN
jgi:hypothetical protein